MSRQEIRYHAKQRRAKEVAKKRMILLLTAIFLIVIGCVVFGSIFSKAHANEVQTEVPFKYYKSIVIQDGDTLWDIAKEYRTNAYSGTQEYVDELIRLNGLHSDKIYAGQHLMVAYYDTEFK